MGDGRLSADSSQRLALGSQLSARSASALTAAQALALFEARRAPLILSAASSWEIAIKVGLGKLSLPLAVNRCVPEQLAADDIDALPVTHAHALRVASVPAHHSDPFDRLLVAQAALERCAQLTAGPQAGRQRQPAVARPRAPRRRR